MTVQSLWHECLSMGTRASEGKVEGRDRKGADEKQKGSDTGQKVSG